MDIIGILLLLALAINITKMKKKYIKNYFEISFYVQNFAFKLHIFTLESSFLRALASNLKGNNKILLNGDEIDAIFSS